MRETMKSCKNCNGKYSYMLSGINCHDYTNNDKYCFPCMHRMIKAAPEMKDALIDEYSLISTLLEAVSFLADDSVKVKIKNTIDMKKTIIEKATGKSIEEMMK